jgi:adenylate cyclase class IV
MFKINKKSSYKLKNLHLHISDKKMTYLKPLATALSQTHDVSALKHVEINNSMTNPEKVKEIFNNLGFDIKKVVNVALENMTIL